MMALSSTNPFGTMLQERIFLNSFREKLLKDKNNIHFYNKFNLNY